MTHQDMNNWVLSVLSREQQAQMFGAVIVRLEGGKVTCVKIERTEKPPQTKKLH